MHPKRRNMRLESYLPCGLDPSCLIAFLAAVTSILLPTSEGLILLNSKMTIREVTGLGTDLPLEALAPTRSTYDDENDVDNGSRPLGRKRKKKARRKSFCHCPFDCINREGIEFHNVSLSGELYSGSSYIYYQ